MLNQDLSAVVLFLVSGIQNERQLDLRVSGEALLKQLGNGRCGVKQLLSGERARQVAVVQPRSRVDGQRLPVQV